MVLNKIEAQAKSIDSLLNNKKYTVDYYQRAYKWETKQIVELFEDLENKFFGEHEEGYSREDVSRYKHYFLGSIIVSEKDNLKFIIDGQQRLTSITLLFIYLHNLLLERGESDDASAIGQLIFSKMYGKKSFNLDIEERTECLDALYNNVAFDVENSPESVRNIVARYEDITSKFPKRLRNGALLSFVDWLRYNVDLVEITTYSDEEAYTIFETMNDRGLSLSPTDMLKSYVLSNIMNNEQRVKANDFWKSRMLDLTQLGKEEDADFFKAWLRGRYAQTIREHKKGSSNKDFDTIGTTFHKWVHDEKSLIGLKSSADFNDFVIKQFKSFSDHYIRIQQAAKVYTPGFEYVYYNAHNNFTLQYPILLAPLHAKDDIETANRKIRLVAGYLDIFIARRAVNFRTLDYSSIVYTMFTLMKEIRELDMQTLVNLLTYKVLTMSEKFDDVSHFSLSGWSKRYVHHMLARMTEHVEKQSGGESRFVNYVARDVKDPYEIEHIWANKYMRHQDEFETEKEFTEYRNHFGGLVLLPRSFNHSYGDKPYIEKISKYLEQNLLVKTLNGQCYQSNPGFIAYKKASKLPFHAHDTFKKADLDARQELYRLLCEEIWSPARFDKELF
ncbi:MAG: DUF262 domain-containing protein [Ktedonobacteraceae bacterium]|nr:DUF262 domain-containing protein [Ktedonobacteraceae bacterium]